MSHGIKQRNTFREVLANCDDQVIVRQLLREFISEEIKQKIVEEFNHHAAEYNKRVIELYGKDELREGCYI